MVIKRVNAISCAKITALLYAIIGFFLGGIAALAAMFGGYMTGQHRTSTFLDFFGLGSLILFPILYAGVGFAITWIAASIYNVLAGFVGGIQIEVETLSSSPQAFTGGSIHPV